MMSHTDSAPDAARLPAAAAGGPSRVGKFMSAILTYFALLVTEKVAIVRSGPARPGKRSVIAPAAQARSHGPLNHNGCRGATQKRVGFGRSVPPSRPPPRRKRHGKT